MSVYKISQSAREASIVKYLVDTRYLSRPQRHGKGQDKILELKESTGRSQGMPREGRRMDHKHKDLGATSPECAGNGRSHGAGVEHLWDCGRRQRGGG